MRVLSLLTHPTTLVWLQFLVILWFMQDFFLARDSSTAHKLFREHATRAPNAEDLIKQIETSAASARKGFACQESLRPTFDKLIFILIDALGAEFLPSLSTDAASQNVSSKQYRMPFVESAIARHQGKAFVAKAATPTVTMPRIKSLVSGTIPSFMDIVYNLASDVSDFHDDNLLQLARAKGKSIVFYGDDTWLALFDRSIFKRVRETLSLYASDYTSVDTNVTEMALPETKRTPLDWDYLILHYLGLDHIGHVFGSNEVPLIGKKLLEMDNVIRELHTDMAAKPERTLIVVCGDHGMSQEGNHGGGTRLESETSMIFLPVNQQLTHHVTRFGASEIEQVQQIDLAATLALLNGLPIPNMSKGVVIERLLDNLWNGDSSKLTCAVLENLVQLSSLLGDNEFDGTERLGVRVSKLLHRMASNATTENARPFIHQGLGLAREIQQELLRTVATKSNSLLVILALSFVMCLSLINMRRSCIRLLMPLMTLGEKLACMGALLVPVLLLNSTDFIEIEHAFWPLYAITVFGLYCFMSLRRQQLKTILQDLEVHRAILFTVTFFITALWNNVRFLGSHDWSWPLPLISVIILCNFSRQTSKIQGKLTIIFSALGLLVFATKMLEETTDERRDEEHFTRVASMQIFALVSLIVISIANIYTSFAKRDKEPTSIVQKLATSWMWWVFLLSRSRQYPFLISNVIMEASLNSLVNTLRLNPITRAIIYLLFSSNAYFGQGNTNLFSSLDIKPAFFGQKQYNLVLAVPLIACATFGSQIYWYAKLFQRVQGEKEQERMTPRTASMGPVGSTLIPANTKDAIKDFVDMRNFLTIGYYLFVCVVLRNHLFIWSVISPKLVYLFMTTLSLRIATTVISNVPQLLAKLHESRGGGQGGAQYKALVD